MFDRYSVIDMFGPIYGENWHNSEINNGSTYRWSHPHPGATLLVPTLGALQIRLRIILAEPPEPVQLDQLELIVNGTPTPLRWSMNGPFVSLWTDIALEKAVSSIPLKIIVPPRSSETAQSDVRKLGLAVSRVEIFALEEEALGFHNYILQDQLRALRLELEASKVRVRPIVKKMLDKVLNYK